jgi:hypothetical protein
MRRAEAQIKAHVAFIAMIVIDAQAQSKIAHVAVVAMENWLVLTVVPKIANITIITCKVASVTFRRETVTTLGLHRTAYHTIHYFDGVAVNGVISVGIVAVPANVEAATARRLDFVISSIMLTSQLFLLFIMIRKCQVLFAVRQLLVIGWPPIRAGTNLFFCPMNIKLPLTNIFPQLLHLCKTSPEATNQTDIEQHIFSRQEAKEQYHDFRWQRTDCDFIHEGGI